VEKVCFSQTDDPNGGGLGKMIPNQLFPRATFGRAPSMARHGLRMNVSITRILSVPSPLPSVPSPISSRPISHLRSERESESERERERRECVYVCVRECVCVRVRVFACICIYTHISYVLRGKKRPKFFCLPRPGKPRTPAIYQVQR